MLYFLLSSFANNPQLFRYCFVAVFFYWIFFCRPLWKCVCCVVTFHTNLFDCLSPLSSYQGKNKCSNKTSLSLSHTHTSQENLQLIFSRFIQIVPQFCYTFLYKLEIKYKYLLTLCIRSKNKYFQFSRWNFSHLSSHSPFFNDFVNETTTDHQNVFLCFCTQPLITHHYSTI